MILTVRALSNVGKRRCESDEDAMRNACGDLGRVLGDLGIDFGSILGSKIGQKSRQMAADEAGDWKIAA